jgi:GTPase SAR1 family protein
MRRDSRSPREGAIQRERNLTVQAIFHAAGMSPATSEKIGQFLVHNGSISYLMYLAHVAQADEVTTDSSVSESTNYAQAFEEELRAHLALEAQIPTSELDAATEILAEVLSNSASAQARLARRSSIARSADKASALFLFSATHTRSALFQALGEPSLAAYQAYSKRYVAKMAKTYGYVSLQHLGQDRAPVELSLIYVEPTLTEAPNPELEIPRRVHDSERQDGELSVREVFARSSRTVILGPAGVGKSTLVRHSISLITQDASEDPPIPFVLELKHFRASISENSGLFKDHLIRDITHMMQHAPPDGWIDYLLLTGRATVFFDGYDEVLNSDDRTHIRDAILSFAMLYPASGIVTTTRIVGYPEVPFSRQEFLHIAVNDFQPGQIEKYAGKWFSIRSSGEGDVGESSVEDFLEETKKYAPDLRANPLMLSLLCTLFYHQGDIPRTLAELYEQCAKLMFQQWSVLRGLEDPGVWELDLRPALFHVAGSILDNSDYLRDGIPKSDLIQRLQDFFRKESTVRIDVARERAQSLVAAWSGRAWVITTVGKDASNRPRFGFVHQSFLEYFAGVNLMRESETAKHLFAKLRERLIHMNGWYVAQIAVAVWHQWRPGGASKFAEVLLRDFRSSKPREGLQLLMFCASLREFVTFTPIVDRLFIDAAISIYIRSLTPLEPGINFSRMHYSSRWESAAIEEGQFGAFDLSGHPRDSLRSMSAHAESEDEVAPVPTTLQTERALSALVNLALGDEAQLDLLLEGISEASTWEAQPGETFLAVSFLLHMLTIRSSVQSTDTPLDLKDRLSSVLRSMYGRLDPQVDYWPAHASAYALGLIDRYDAIRRVPWNSAIARESIVLSYIADFDLPCLVRGDVVRDYLHGNPESSSMLKALGESFLADYERASAGEPICPVPAYDWTSMIELRSGPQAGRRLGRVNDAGWGPDHLAGLFVTLGICVELDRKVSPSCAHFGERTSADKSCLAAYGSRTVHQPATCGIPI